MIAFEHTASDPKRLFQPSFQLVEEEKFRRRAYPALLKLESTLVEAIEKFERGKKRCHAVATPLWTKLQERTNQLA